MLCELHLHLPHEDNMLSPAKTELAVTQYSDKSGAGDGDRTRDFLLGKEMLYH
jgi:hypothetical protein